MFCPILMKLIGNDDKCQNEFNKEFSFKEEKIQKT